LSVLAGGRIAVRWRRLPLRIRLVAGFSGAMMLVLAGAGTFVYLRVQYALDLRLDEDLAAQAAQVVQLASGGTLPQDQTGAMSAAGMTFQVLDRDNHVLARSASLTDASLLQPEELDAARHRSASYDRGRLFPIGPTSRVLAMPIADATQPAPGRPAVAVVAIRRDQRDEALRELIGQLALANFGALAIASFVGYRLTRAALSPVERYRAQAAEIAAGATGVRLAVPATADDEIARLGNTLNEMLAALDNALATERRFVNDASHELRTPLTLLSTELELALRRPRSVADLEETIRVAASDTAHLVALTTTLLDISQRDRPPHDVVDLTELTSGLVDRHRAVVPVEPSEASAVVAVRGDAIRLRRVLTNLLENAARHGAAPITVTVAERRSGAEPVAVITISDRGPGIAPDFLPQATERFRRADAARTTPGTGLGLSLVDSIVNAHDGELRLCSGGHHFRSVERFDIACVHPADGTTATVLLPAQRARQ
jgi:signal transduction histidine kinase